MATERVLITVKTYPTLSRKYGETVCTAGVREDGTWMRIYPVPFRRLDEAEQYRKFDWIETDFVKSKSDPRPETYHPADIMKLVPSGHMGKEDKWREPKPASRLTNFWRRRTGASFPMRRDGRRTSSRSTG